MKSSKLRWAKTVYISGPITDKIGHSIHFEQASSWLKNEGHIVLNPMDILSPLEKGVDCSTEEEKWGYYMKEAVRMLTTADCIYLLEDWEKSKGARLEFNLATELHIPVHYAQKDHNYV